MKIAVAGAGYVGLVTAVCMAEKGHHVSCVDIDENKINTLQNGISPIYEPDLEELMSSNAERLTYTIDYQSAYKDAEIIFIGVGTPEKKDGSANLTYVYAVAKQIAEYIQNDCVVVVKSTVPIGTNEKVVKILKDSKAHDVKIDVASNPEFLAQGTAVKTVKAAIEVNELQKLKLIKKARKYYDSFDGLTVAVLGLTFKPGTDDLRDAPSLVNIPILLDDGAKVKVCLLYT